MTEQVKNPCGIKMRPSAITPEPTRMFLLAQRLRRNYVRIRVGHADVELCSRTLYLGGIHDPDGSFYVARAASKFITDDDRIHVGNSHDPTAGVKHRALKDVAVDAFEFLCVPRILPYACGWQKERARADFAFWDNMGDMWFGEVATSLATIGSIKTSMGKPCGPWLLYIVESGSPCERLAMKEVEKRNAHGIMSVNFEVDSAFPIFQNVSKNGDGDIFEFFMSPDYDPFPW